MNLLGILVFLALAVIVTARLGNATLALAKGAAWARGWLFVRHGPTLDALAAGVLMLVCGWPMGAILYVVLGLFTEFRVLPRMKRESEAKR